MSEENKDFCQKLHMQEDCKDICKVLWEKNIWLRIVYLPTEKGFQKWKWSELFLTSKNEENSLPADLNHKNHFRQNEHVYNEHLDQYKEIKIINKKVEDEYEKIIGYL